MFVVPNCQPAMELYGLLEVNLCTSEENLETSKALEHRLQLLGIKNSAIQEKLGVKTSFETSDPNKPITPIIDPFEPINFEQKLEKNEMTEKKYSARLWLWHKYLAQHGNCSLCERPLNGLNEVNKFQTLNIKAKINLCALSNKGSAKQIVVVMLTCAHAVHPECAQEIYQNRNGCQRCEINQMQLKNRKRNGKDQRKKCPCCR